MTNWCCALQSGISNLEVENERISKRTRLKVPNHKHEEYVFGVIWSFAYKLDGSEEELVVATTRPETMLGDTAVAVHPDDPRYKQFHGKYLKHPFVDRKIKVITDPVLVDMNFGTGAVKVTPAHDPNDFACGRRNGLEEITIFTAEGKMTEDCGRFAGMMRFDARVEVLKALKEMNLFRGEEDNEMSIPTCQRTGDIVEPILKPQWWVDCKGMAKRATDAVRKGELKILPVEQEKKWFAWLDEIQPWCVSRQLWWGHRIPAYFVSKKGDEEDERNVVVAATLEEATRKAEELMNCNASSLTLRQDEDVLDTWFSSGLFPFSCLGWPDNTPDYLAWHPTTLLETGQDILFFWVARMVMCSLQLTNKLPFTEVYLHSMVRDKHGRKMSKSLGNVIDPLEVIEGVSLALLCDKIKQGNLPTKEVEKAIKEKQEEYPEGIKECGSDALRFGLLSHVGHGKDINLDVRKVAAYSEFCNKLWNATKFAFMYITKDDAFFTPSPLPVSLNLLAPDGLSPRADLHSLPDAWILSRLADAVDKVDTQLGKYEIADAAQTIYDFWYRELCDVYLEAIKPIVQLDVASVSNRAIKHQTLTVLHCCLHNGLRLLHPFMPFVTEELYHRLALLCGEQRTSIMLAPYPSPAPLAALRSPPAEHSMKVIRTIAKSILTLRSLYLKGMEKHAPVVYMVCRDPKVETLVRTQTDTISALAKASKSAPLAALHLVPEGCDKPAGCVTEVIDQHTSVHVMLKGVVDLTPEVQRLKKELAAKLIKRTKLTTDQANPNYHKKPTHKQEEDTKELAEVGGQIEYVEKMIRELEAI